MSKHVRDMLKGSQRGFTLIELMAVMAILGILVAIVAPAAINSERGGVTAQAQADSQSVRNAATQFFSDQNDAEVRTPHSVTLTTEVNGATTTATQMVSSRWAENFITQGTGVPTLPGKTATSTYSHIFETVASSTQKVVNVNLTTAKDAPISGSAFLTEYAAIDLDQLIEDGLLSKLPDGVGKTSATGVGTLRAPNFLWLFKKASSSLGEDDDRAIVVFTLVEVEQIEAAGGATTVNLTYKQILGP